MKAFSLLILGFLISGPAFAQYVVRNGGYVAECQNSPLLALEIMEGQIQGEQFRYSPRRYYQEKADDMINRIAIADQDRAKKYRTWLSTWRDDIEWQPGLDTQQPNDQGAMKLPLKLCRLRVAIVQTHRSKSEFLKYWINPFVWHNLDENQKAALVVHELLYRDLIENSADDTSLNSNFIRQVNLRVHTLNSPQDAEALKALLSYL